MATLTVTALDVSGSPLNGEQVQVSLCDSLGTALREFTAEGLLVSSVLGHTDAAGLCTLEVVPNVLVLRDNTYYEVKVGHSPPVLILKNGSSQSLFAAQATSPLALGPAATLGSLGDVDLTGVQIGDAIQWDGTQWTPVEWVDGGGGGGAPEAHAASHLSAGTDPIAVVTTIANGLARSTDLVKLNTIATSATANATDAQLRDRSTHTGTQAHTTITGLGTAAVANTGAFEPAGAVSTAIAALLAGAPSALDTLDEIAAALADDANFAATITTALSNKQAIAAALTQISGLSPSNDDLLQRKAGVWTNRTMAQLLVDILAAGLTTTLAGKQPLDSDLTAIAALSPTNGNVIVGNGSAWTSAPPAAGGSAVSFVDAYVTSGSITLQDTSSVWTLIPTSTPGIPELAIPAVVGDRIEVSGNFLTQSGNNNYLDIVVAVSGSIVRYMATGTGTGLAEGNPGFYPVLSPIPGPQSFVVQSGDIDGGNVRFRMANVSGGPTRILYAQAAYPFYWCAKNYHQ